MSAEALAAEAPDPEPPETLAEWISDEYEGAEVATSQTDYLEAWVSSAFSLPTRFVQAGWRIAGVNGSAGRRAYVILAREGV